MIDDSFVYNFNNPPQTGLEYDDHFRNLFYQWRTPGQCIERFTKLQSMNLKVLTKKYLIQFLLVDDEITIFSKYFNIKEQLTDDELQLLLFKLVERPGCAYYYYTMYIKANKTNTKMNIRCLHPALMKYIMANNFKTSQKLLEVIWSQCTNDNKLSLLGTTAILMRSKTFRQLSVVNNKDYNDDGIAGLLYIGKNINLDNSRSYRKFLHNFKTLHESLNANMPHIAQDEYYDIVTPEKLLSICLSNVRAFPDASVQRSAWNIPYQGVAEFFKLLDWNKVETDKQIVLPYDDIHYRYMTSNIRFLGMEHIDRDLVDICNNKLYTNSELRRDVKTWAGILNHTSTGSKRSKLVNDAIKELCTLIVSDAFTDDFKELTNGILLGEAGIDNTCSTEGHKSCLIKLPLAQALYETHDYSPFVLSLVKYIYTINHNQISLLPSGVRYILAEANPRFITEVELDRNTSLLNQAPLEIIENWTRTRNQMLPDACTNIFKLWETDNCTANELITLIEGLGLDYMNNHLQKLLKILDKIPLCDMLNKQINITKSFRLFDALEVLLIFPWSISIDQEEFYHLLLMEKYDIISGFYKSMNGVRFSITLPETIPAKIVSDLVKHNIIDSASIPDGMELDMDKCAICLRYLNDAVNTIKCKHSFHHDCLLTWIYASTESDDETNDIINLRFLTAKCPICRGCVFSINEI